MGHPAKSEPWAKIFADNRIYEHDFDSAPFPLSSQQIKDSTKHFPKTGQREVRILLPSRKKRSASSFY